MAVRKKKKKEELDASLMGWNLPGAIVPAMSAPVSALRKLPSAPPFINWRWRYIPRYGEGDRKKRESQPPAPGEIVRFTGATSGFWRAWGFYGIGGIADPKNFAEAAAYSRILGIPYIAGYAMAGAIGFFVTGLGFTFIDPLHKWEGGLDETAFYERRVTNAVRKSEWGADQGGKKNKPEYSWGTTV